METSFKLFEKYENVILYHGSKTEFDEFDDSKISSGESSELFGKGYYFTDNYDIAVFYAKLVSKKDKITKYTHDGIFGSEVPHYSKDADEYADKNFKVNSFRITGNILDSYTYILDDKFIDIIKGSFIKNDGLGRDESIKFIDERINFIRNNKEKYHNYRGELLYILKTIVLSDNEQLKDIVNYIKKIGYDGIKYKPDTYFEEDKGQYNYAIFNKNIIHKIK